MHACRSTLEDPTNDDLDLPVDGNPCTQDVCTAGTPGNPFVTAGNSCGATTICDGQGACVTCLTPASCPGTDTDCRHRTCVNGACGMADVANGMAVATQTAGDCKKTVCMSGAPMVVGDNLDLPVDGNPCTSDVCATGTPSNPNLASGTACGTSQMCNGQGACVGCLTAADCGTNTTCQTHTCTNNTCGVTNAPVGTAWPTQTAGDCKKVQCDGQGQQQTVDDDSDLPVDSNACTKGQCMSGNPSQAPETAGTACSQGGGTKCNGSGTAPACVQCLNAGECPGSDTECRIRTCTNGVCGTSDKPNGTEVSGQMPGDCKKKICMGGSEMAVDDNADLPVDGNGCTLDLCNAGAPQNMPRPANAPCSEDGGTRCNGSTTAPACVQCLAHADCGNNNDCQKFTCSAAGQCVTNNSPDMTPLPPELQTTGDCKTEVCNGIGGKRTIANSNDTPNDANACTSDICTDDVPSHQPLAANSPCDQGGGTRCNGSPTAPACVQCTTNGHCGTDTDCLKHTCSAAGACSSMNEPEDKLVTTLPAGDCHKDVCKSGLVTPVVDTTDVFVDGNLCTDDQCSAGGVPQNPNVSAGMSCGEGLMCNGTGACVGCLTELNCPPPPNDCQTTVCMNGTCGFLNVANGVEVKAAAGAGNCLKIVCMNGEEVTMNDDTDLPVDGNACTEDKCAGGVASNPFWPTGTSCTGPNNANQCNGLGACVECTNADQCPGGADTDCQIKTCSTAGVCGIFLPPSGTPVKTQSSGDCKKKVCNGNGLTRDDPDDSDTPPNNNECALTMCMGGEGMTTNRPHGTLCTQDNGRTCNGTGSCLLTFNLVRVGTGSAALTNNATAVFVQEHSIDGMLRGTVALPTAETGANHAFTLSGTASSLGNLTLSGDGRYVVLAGFNRAVGASTENVGNSSSVGTNRLPARIDAMGQVDTTTLFGDMAFTGDNVRGATTNDGTGFWLAGTSNTIGFGGVWYAARGSSSGTQVAMTGNSRCLGVSGGQLYGTSNTSPYVNVFTVGTGLPTTGTQTANGLPDMTASGGPFSFVFFDRTTVPGVDTLYVADDGGSTTRGIQKWTKSVDTQGNPHWSRQVIFNVSPAVGFHGVTGYITGGTMTLIANTAEGDTTLNRVVIFVETSDTTATATTLLTAPANTFFRGVALSPHL